MQPGVKAPASRPQVIQERAAFESVPRPPACVTQKLTKDEHQGTESAALPPWVLAW